MTVANESIELDTGSHIVLHDVSWEFYEHLLEEIGNRPIRVTFDEGNIEIMSPLPKQERAKKAIAGLLEAMALELDVPLASYGSTTFRRKDKQKGLEPDECYYRANADLVQGMEKFDPKTHPAPDLAIEVDITNRSIQREPIYAALGVRELWRFDGQHLHVLQLDQSGEYTELRQSPSFPFLPIDEFESFVMRMKSEPQTKVLRAFQQWVRTLPR